MTTRRLTGGLADLAFVIVTFNRPERLLACVDSIRRFVGVEHSIIVVDNSFDNETERVLKGHDVMYIKTDYNVGPGAGRNLGASISTHEFVFFLDDDAYLIADPLTPELSGLFAEPAVAAVGYPIRELSLDTVLYGRKTGRVKFFAAGAVCFRRSAFQAAGGFDERLRWSEEFDLSVRLAREGFMIMALAGPEVIHDAAVPPTDSHSKEKLSKIMHARLRSLLKSFSMRAVLLMSTRMVIIVIAKNRVDRSFPAVFSGLRSLWRDRNEIKNLRAPLEPSAERVFLIPDDEEDELSVPLWRKAFRLLRTRSSGSPSPSSLDAPSRRA